MAKVGNLKLDDVSSLNKGHIFIGKCLDNTATYRCIQADFLIANILVLADRDKS